MSLQEFRDAFLKDTLDLLWGQWCVLGVAGHSRTAGNYCIDPEALMLATCHFGRFDQRLFDGMLGWLSKYEEMLSLQRVSSLIKIERDSRPPVIEAVAAYVLSEYKKPRWRKLAGAPQATINGDALFHYPDGSQVEAFGYQDPLFLSYGLSRGRIESKNIIGSFETAHPASLWLRLRAFMGVSSRTDILVYLLIYEGGGHPSLIAREIGYSQRGVHQSLLAMSLSGWILRSERAREVLYTLADPIRETLASSSKGKLEWLTWNRYFQGLKAFWNVLSRPTLKQLSPEALAAELRGAMQTAQQHLSQVGLLIYFHGAQEKKGGDYVEALATAWSSLFTSFYE